MLHARGGLLLTPRIRGRAFLTKSAIGWGVLFLP